jgi:hypothetical protein
MVFVEALVFAAARLLLFLKPSAHRDRTATVTWVIDVGTGLLVML